MKEFVKLSVWVIWIAGMVLAKGFWSTFFAVVTCGFWSAYLVEEKLMQMAGWL
jgi:hypothetical protein